MIPCSYHAHTVKFWTWNPYTKGCFVLRLGEIGLIVLEKRIFKFRQCNVFSLLFTTHLWKEQGPSFEQTWISFTRGYIVSGLVEFGPIKAYVFDNVEEWQRTIILTETKISKNDTWASLYIFCALIQYHWLLIVSPTVKIRSI